MSQSKTLKYNQLLDQCDLYIKSGNINAVVKLISKINLLQIPRSFKQSFAKIFRRSGLITHGIRLLHPIIRNDKVLTEPPTSSEICEYASLISRIGSSQESIALLADINPTTNPEALLYSGFCHVSNWNYAEAQKHFERYLTHDMDDYSKLIAKVNLSACYVGAGHMNQAIVLINECLEHSVKAKSLRLQGNCLELRGQANALNFNFNQAKKDLALAEEIFKNSQSYDALLIDKWKAIIEAFETKSSDSLVRFRKNAVIQNHWESVRESDLFTSRIKFEQNCFDQIIFGTPSQFYQGRALELVGLPASKQFTWGDHDSAKINLTTAESSDENKLGAGKKMHCLLQSLLGDLYAPRSIAALFADIYPDEYFNIDSSPIRIRQLVQRLRKWFAENSHPVQIFYDITGYRLVVSKGLGFVLDRNSNHALQSADDLFFQKLKTSFKNSFFNINEACCLLDISESSFHRLIRKKMVTGQINKCGKARATTYRFAEI